MGIPTWSSGQVLTASDVNTWFVPLAVVKSADESVTSSTTVQNDDELVLSVAASCTYAFDLFIIYEGGTQGSSDLKMQYTLPAGATGHLDVVYLDSSGGQHSAGDNTASSTWTAGTAGAGNNKLFFGRGIVVISSTAGSLQIQWAQGTSSGTATKVKTNSYMMLRRLA